MATQFILENGDSILVLKNETILKNGERQFWKMATQFYKSLFAYKSLFGYC